VLVLVLLATMVLAVQAKVSSSRDNEIRSAVEAYVKQKTASLGCEIRLKRFAYNDAVSLPEGNLEYEISAPQQWEGWGSASIAVIIRQGEKVVSNIPVWVEVEALADMVVSLRQMDHGTVVTSADVALKKLDVSGTQGRYLARIEDVVGKKTRSTIRANVPFKADQLEKLPLIKSGQLVTIIAENERMRITLTGKARSAGGEGDSITVQNTNSLKEFPARVVDATTVMVPF
jgi:flagella basal body P-ring formation protein FlgA